MQITVNGEQQELPERATVTDLLEQIGLTDTLVAVERNHHIVPRAEHKTATLRDGDRVEVVHFVGGG